ncbi:hypothetical protein D3C72_2264250 [compost metagenome]
MKQVIALALVILGSANFAFAAEKIELHNYLCISNTLQAYDSDTYLSMTVQDINQLLQTPNDARSEVAREVTAACDKKAFASQ